MPAFATFPDLPGKVAIVTGIGQIGSDSTVRGTDPKLWGNGAATARLLALNGVKVFGCDINIESAQHTQDRIRTEGGVVEVVKADVTKAEDVKRLVADCVRTFGRVDILVNNVGRSEPGGPVEMEEHIW